MVNTLINVSCNMRTFSNGVSAELESALSDGVTGKINYLESGGQQQHSTSTWSNVTMANRIYICDTLDPRHTATLAHRGDPSLRKNTINGPQKIVTCFWEYSKVCGNKMADESKVADTPLSFTLHTHIRLS